MASERPSEEPMTSGSEAEELYEPGTESEATDMTETTEDDSEESEGQAFEEALEEVLGQQVTDDETGDEEGENYAGRCLLGDKDKDYVDRL